MARSLIYAQLIFVMIMWGFNVIAIKIIVEQFSPVTITALRIFLATIVVWMFIWMHKQFRMIKRKELAYVLLASLTGVAGHHFFLAVGLAATTASNTGLILGTVPLATSILAAIILRERLSFMRVIGIIFGLAGVSVIMMAGQTDSLSVNIGDFYIFLAVLSQAFSFIFIKKASETMETKLITGSMFLIGSILLLIIGLNMEPNGFASLSEGTLLGWIVFLASGILATGIGHFMYNHAIQHIGAGKTSIFLNMSPFFALVGSFIFLGEQIAGSQIFGFIFIVISVILGSGLADHYIYKKAQKRGFK